MKIKNRIITTLVGLTVSLLAVEGLNPQQVKAQNSNTCPTKPNLFNGPRGQRISSFFDEGSAALVDDRLEEARTKLEASLQSFDEAVILARRVEETSSRAPILINLGFVHHQLGEFDRAIQLYEDAVRESKKSDPQQILTQSVDGKIFAEFDYPAYYFMAFSFYKRGQETATQADLQKAKGFIDLVISQKPPEMICSTWIDWGNVYLLQGDIAIDQSDLEEAMSAYKKARTEFESHGSKIERSLINHKLGKTELDRQKKMELDQQNYEQAKIHLRESIELSDQTNAAAFNDLGVVFFVEKDYEAAEDNFLMAVSLEPSNEIYRSNGSLASERLRELSGV